MFQYYVNKIFSWLTIILFYVNINIVIFLLFAAIAQKVERIFEGDGLVKVRVLLAAPRGFLK